MSVHGAIHLDSSSTGPTKLDPNAHTGDWTRTIGIYTVVAVVAAVVLRSLCCASKGRSVNDTDAPELEEFGNEGGTAKRVDAIRVKGGRYVSAAASRQLDAADDDDGGDDSQWGARSREPRAKTSRSAPQPKPTPKSKPKQQLKPKPRSSSREEGMKPARHPL